MALEPALKMQVTPLDAVSLQRSLGWLELVLIEVGV